MRFISVDLPEPGGAHDGHELVPLDGQGHAPEGLDLLLVELVDLPEVLDEDDDGVRPAHDVFDSFFASVLIRTPSLSSRREA